VEATVEPGEPNRSGFPPARSVWYSWNADLDGFLIFSKQDQQGPASLGVYVGAAVNTLTEVRPIPRDSTFSRYSFPVQKGVTYHMSINHFGAGTPFTYSWQFLPPPANDNFGNAQLISGESGSLFATTQVATVEPGEPHAQDGNSLWYLWTAPRSGSFRFNVAGYTDSHHFYSGSSLDALTELVQVDFYQGLRAVAGTRFLIQISGTGSWSPIATGDFTMAWAPGPVNDDFAGATSIDGNSGTISGTLIGATMEPNEPPTISGYTVADSVWYAWTAPETKWYTFNETGSPALIAAYKGSSVDSLIRVMSGRVMTFHADAGTTYQISTAREPILFPSGSDFALAWHSGNSSTDGALLNLSTRAKVGVDSEVLIGGFIIRGDSSKKVIIRAIGPSMKVGGIPVSGRLADPVLELHDSTGATIFSNDDWITSPQKEEIMDSTLSPAHDKESAIVATLAPGSYTAIIRGSDNDIGVALMEIYDLQVASQSRLLNVSTRGKVGINDNVMIGGVIMGGSLPLKLGVRALGPSLTNGNPTVSGALARPEIEVRDSNGFARAFNAGWKRSYAANEIAASGLAPPDDNDAALIMTLEPGNYTAIVRGLNGATGVALIEVYNLN
jgi:hypothetical protein